VGSGVVGGTDPDFKERVEEMASFMRPGNDSTHTVPVEEVIDGAVPEATLEIGPPYLLMGHQLFLSR